MGLFKKGNGESEGGSKSAVFGEMLLSLGYRYESDGDGDLVFMREGRTYVLLAHEEDRQFVSILFPNFWPIENERERSAAYVAACEATANTKGAKVYPVRDNMFASREMLVSEPEQLDLVFERGMSMLQAVVRNFVEEMQDRL